jgi:hypothetical protein
VVIRRVIVPPYCGVPSLSHQFPVVLTVVVVGLVEDIVAWLIVEVVVLVVLVEILGVVDVVDVEVELVHDTKIIDITMRQVSSNSNVLLFILSSSNSKQIFWEIDNNLVFRIILFKST